MAPLIQGSLNLFTLQDDARIQVDFERRDATQLRQMGTVPITPEGRLISVQIS